MLDIVILFVCGKALAGICRAKGRDAWPWVLMMIFLWYGGIVVGAFFGGFISGFMDGVQGNQNAEPNWVLVFGLAIIGGILGMVTSFMIVKFLPDESHTDDDDYDRPRRFRSRRDDYDDDEDDEDDRPRRRRRYDDEEDDDTGDERDDRGSRRYR